jgi:hypothetical protein
MHGDYTTPYSSKGRSFKSSLESDRDQNLPLEACLGELIDNSFEWKAKNVWIDYEALTTDGWGRAKSLAICDDGLGMNPEKLRAHLTIGFHDAFGGDQSSSVSKYGVGAKYAFFNTCRKSEVWSKEKGGEWHKAEFDFDDPYLDETEDVWKKDFEEGRGSGYPRVSAKEFPPNEYSSYWKDLESGTFIRWSKFDKVTAEVKGDEQLIWWLEKAFRNIIGEKIIAGEFSDDGWSCEKKIIDNPNIRNIIFNGDYLRAYDSLYAIPFKDNDVLEEDAMGMDPIESLVINFPIDDEVWVKRLGKRTSPIVIHFGLAPRSWRMKSGQEVWTKSELSAYLQDTIQKRRIQGGSTSGGGNSWWDSRKFVSVLRAGREVGNFSDHLLTGKRREDTDRWMGITIEFGPELDRAFNVRNIKFQVEPSADVKKRIREEIKSTVREMENEIKDWFKKQRDIEVQRRELLNPPTKKPGSKIKTPSKPEDWADVNKPSIGDLPDTPNTPDELLDKLFGDMDGFNRDEVLDEIARRKLTIKNDLATQVPNDTDRMFEYTAKGGNVLKIKYQNHLYYKGLQKRYHELMEIGKEISLELENGEIGVEEMKQYLAEITMRVRELEEIRDLGMNAAVIALAKQAPRGETLQYRDIFLRDWGQICQQMIKDNFYKDSE